MELSLSGFIIQLHFHLLHLKVAEELALGWGLANEVIDRMNEADYRLVIRHR